MIIDYTNIDNNESLHSTLLKFDCDYNCDCDCENASHNAILFGTNSTV